MRTSRLLLICVVAWSAHLVRPSWFNWLARLEWQIFPLAPRGRFFGHPPFTSLFVEIIVPVFWFISFPVGIAAVGAIVASLLIARFGVQPESL